MSIWREHAVCMCAHPLRQPSPESAPKAIGREVCPWCYVSRDSWALQAGGPLVENGRNRWWQADPVLTLWFSQAQEWIFRWRLSRAHEYPAWKWGQGQHWKDSQNIFQTLVQVPGCPRRHVYLIANAFSLALTLNICGHVWTLTPVSLHVCVVKLQRTHKDIFPVRPSFVLTISWQQTLSKSYYQATAFQRLHDETFVRTGGADIQRAVTHRK